MSRILSIIVSAMLLQVSAFAQGSLVFSIDFGSAPPPHALGVPESGATLTNDLFSAAIYLDGTTPTSGSILQKLDGGSFTPVFQFTNLVFAGYPPPAIGAAYSYEGAWQLTDAQIQSLLAGQWYAEVNYGSTAYRGQIAAIPEPPSAALLVSGTALAFLAHCWIQKARRHRPG